MNVEVQVTKAARSGTTGLLIEMEASVIARGTAERVVVREEDAALVGSVVEQLKPLVQKFFMKVWGGGQFKHGGYLFTVDKNDLTRRGLINKTKIINKMKANTSQIFNRN